MTWPTVSFADYLVLTLMWAHGVLWGVYLVARDRGLSLRDLAGWSA